MTFTNTLIDTMIDNVIRRFGHEDRRTIKFCGVAEKYDYETVVREYNKLMK